MLEILNNKYFLESAKSQQQLVEAKALDDLAFGPHLGISMEELIEIVNHGAVLLLKDLDGKLIAESQVITSPISQHTILEQDEAYNYGTAVHPDYQNKGIAQILFNAQETVAIKAGKSRNTLTARLENAQSLRGRFKAGYQIVGYDANRYGPFEQGGARLVMEKHHFCPTEVFSPQILIEMFLKKDILYIDKNNIDQAIERNSPFLALSVAIGDNIDFEAHEIISKTLVSKKYMGVGLLKSTELYGNTNQPSVLILKHV